MRWLEAQQQAPAALLDFLARQRPNNEIPLRIGRYAERLLAFYLTHGPTHRLLASHLVRTDTAPPYRTLGEIDFLVEDQHGQCAHWELALKYFVARDTATPNLADYIGPDGSEALTRKLRRLARQLAQPVPAPWDGTALTRAAFTRGVLYYRHPPTEVPAELATNHARGFWLPFAALPQELPPSTYYAILPRSHWLAPVAHHTALTGPELVAALADAWQQQMTSPWAPAHPTSIMVAQLVPGPPWREVARGFITPPALAAVFAEPRDTASRRSTAPPIDGEATLRHHL